MSFLPGSLTPAFRSLWCAHIVASLHQRTYPIRTVIQLLDVEKQKEPITQSIRNRREHSSRFKVMFYVIGSEKSKSGSASYNSRRQNQRRGGAVRYFRCTDTVPDKSDFHKICLNISIFSFRVDKLSTTLLYKQRHRLSRFAQEMFVGSAVSFL